MSLTIKHPEPEFTGDHSGLSFADGVAEISALEQDAREPLLANGFTIEGEDDEPESDEDRAKREADEAAEAAAVAAAADEAKRVADEEAKVEAARVAAKIAEAEQASAKAAAKK